MASKASPRDITPFLQILRNFLLGRKWNHTGQLRFAKDVAPRPGAKPELPDGPAARLSANYYYTRDARREHQPPALLVEGSAKMLPAKGETSTTAKPPKPVPGVAYQWKEVPFKRE